MKKVDTGGLSFSRIRESQFYYVDKSLLIKDILDTNPEGVYLFTRPRRFGKTTNITMLDAFFNQEYAGNTWFDGLAISEHHEYDFYRNAYPVIDLDLKDTEAKSFDDYIDGFYDAIIDATDPFSDILEDTQRITKADYLKFERIWERKASKAELKSSIFTLCRVLEKCYGTKPVILIDEYDRAVTNAFSSAVMSDIIDFLGGFMSKTLKSNDHRQFAYVTGITQIAKAGMFSGTNNVTVDSTFSTMSDERFGFTESEVRDILSYYGRTEKFDEVRQWYDGYRFGKVDVYNPFSVMMYIQNSFVPERYWVDTSKAVPIKWMLRRVDLSSIAEIANMVNGNASACPLQKTMTFDDLKLSQKEGLYSLMVMTGYLNAVPRDDGDYDLSIPNREVMSEAEDLLKKNIVINTELFARFNGAVLDGDADTAADVLGRILCDASYFDLSDETSYELIVLTILHAILGDYEVTSQKEAGNGRADLILISRREGMPHIIIELKVSENEGSLDRDVNDALAQIHSRRYYLGMKGAVIVMGLAFFGKLPKARSEVLHL